MSKRNKIRQLICILLGHKCHQVCHVAQVEQDMCVRAYVVLRAIF